MDFETALKKMRSGARMWPWPSSSGRQFFMVNGNLCQYCLAEDSGDNDIVVINPELESDLILSQTWEYVNSVENKELIRRRNRTR